MTSSEKSRSPREPFRKTWDVFVEPRATSEFSDVGKRREPLPESAAWNIISYLLAGLLMFGVPGFVLDRVLGTTWLVGVGIVLGMAVAVLTIWLRYGTDGSMSATPDDAVPTAPDGPSGQHSTTAPRPTPTTLEHARVPSVDRPQEDQQ